MRYPFQLLFLLAILTVGGTLRAQGTPDDTSRTAVARGQFDSVDVSGRELSQRLSFSVGLNFGLTSGMGVSVGAIFPFRLETQLNFFVISMGGYFHYNVGLEGRYNMIRKDGWQLYALLGMSYYSSELRDDKEAEQRPGNRVANPFRIGPGIGYGWFASEQFVVTVSGAITVFPTTGEVLPLPQLGLAFVF